MKKTVKTPEVKEESSIDEIIPMEEVAPVEVLVEATHIQRLQKKYSTQIEQAKGHYVRGLDREAIMEILRGVEKYMGRSIHLGDLSCGPCVIDLVSLLGSLK